MTRLVTLVLAVCLSMAAAAGVAGTAHARSERPAVASKATAEQAPEPKSWVSKAEYKKLKKGMTVAQIKRLVGSNGKNFTACGPRVYQGWGRGAKHRKVLVYFDPFDPSKGLISRGWILAIAPIPLPTCPGSG